MFQAQSHQGPVLIKLENGTLFFRLRLPSTLFSIENGTFRKRSPEWKNLKTPASLISVDGEHFENETFRNRRRSATTGSPS